MQKTAQGELFMIRNGLVTDVGPPFRPARHRVTDLGWQSPPTAISGGPDGGFIRASTYHDHMDSVAAWQARYSPWRPHWTCKPHAPQTVMARVRGISAPPLEIEPLSPCPWARKGHGALAAHAGPDVRGWRRAHGDLSACVPPRAIRPPLVPMRPVISLDARAGGAAGDNATL